MSASLFNFIDDLPAIRRHFADRVRAQMSILEPINKVVIGFHLDQIGTLLLYFETGDPGTTGGNWSLHADKDGVEFSYWPETFESVRDEGGTFILPSDERVTLKRGASEQEIAAVFVKALLSVALDAIARGTFAPLPLSPNCDLIIEEYDCLYSFPNTGDEENLFKKLPTVLLPR